MTKVMMTTMDNGDPTSRIPDSSSSSVTKTACAMDLGNRASYHRSAGVKTTGKNSEYEKNNKKTALFKKQFLMYEFIFSPCYRLAWLGLAPLV